MRPRSPFWRLVERHGGRAPVDEPLDKALPTNLASEASKVARAHLDAWLVELLGADVAGLSPERVDELIAGGYIDPAAAGLRFGGLDPWGAVMAMGLALAAAGPAAEAMHRWSLAKWQNVLPPPAAPVTPPAAVTSQAPPTPASPPAAPQPPAALGAPTAPFTPPPGPPAEPPQPPVAHPEAPAPPPNAPRGGALIPAPPEGLGAAEREAWIQARTRAGEYARGLGNIVADDLDAKVVEVWDEAEVIAEADREQRLANRETIREATAEAVARGWAADRLASELANRTEDWGRNWKRIAVTELQGAMNDAVVISALRLDGEDARIARIPETDACEACRALFLGADGRPRIFVVTDLVANGTNVGKKREDWKATIWPTHPSCRCSTQRIPAGFAFNAQWELVRVGA